MQAVRGEVHKLERDRWMDWLRRELPARGLRRLLGTALFLVVVYVGLRLFGDEAVLSMLDALEARLLVGWERALQYLQGLRAAGFGAVVAGGLSTCGDCR